MTGERYDAFISYRRSDGGSVARWLRRELEDLRLPRPLRATYGRRLRVYLDTAYQRGTLDFYRDTIRPALLASRFLIIVATPDAAQRRTKGDDWIAREIDDFVAGPNRNNVVVVRGAGVFDGPLPGMLHERFPNAELVDLRGASRAGSLNPLIAGRLSSEKLKIVAPLLDLPADLMPSLRREQERRGEARFVIASGLVAAVLVALSGLTILAVEGRHRAVLALDDSAAAAGFMALRASELPRNLATESARRFLVNQACDLLDKFDSAGGGGSRAEVESLVTCRLERASEHERLQEAEAAERLINDAIAIADDAYRRSRTPDQLASLILARAAMVQRRLTRGEIEAAALELSRITHAAEEASSVNLATQRLLVEAHQAVAERRTRPADAAQGFASAAAMLEKLLAAAPKIPEPVEELQKLSRLYSELGRSLAEAGDLSEAISQLARAVAVRARHHPPASEWPPNSEADAVHALLRLVEMANVPGSALADRARAAALESIDRIAASSAVSEILKADAQILQAQLVDPVRAPARRAKP